MPELLLFLSIAMIVCTTAACVLYALTLHHRRECERIQNREYEVQRIHQLSHEKLDLERLALENKLPPPRIRTDIVEHDGR